MKFKDADKLIELIDDDIASLDENMSREGYDVCLCTLQMAKQYIKALPTVDTVLVVRCKDCKHFQTDDCPWALPVINVNDYCSRGVRKESEDNALV